MPSPSSELLAFRLPFFDLALRARPAASGLKTHPTHHLHHSRRYARGKGPSGQRPWQAEPQKRSANPATTAHPCLSLAAVLKTVGLHCRPSPIAPVKQAVPFTDGQIEQNGDHHSNKNPKLKTSQTTNLLPASQAETLPCELAALQHCHPHREWPASRPHISPCTETHIPAKKKMEPNRA